MKVWKYESMEIGDFQKCRVPELMIKTKKTISRKRGIFKELISKQEFKDNLEKIKILTNLKGTLWFICKLFKHKTSITTAFREITN